MLKDDLLMRHRQYGKVDILDTSKSSSETHCSPKIFPYKAHHSNMSHLFS